jgi:HEAT repeat protein
MRSMLQNIPVGRFDYPPAAEAASELYRRFAETPSRSDYAFALAKLGDPAVPSLVGALTHDNPQVRKEAAWTLERTVGDLQPAIPRLASMLRDPEGPVRQAAGHTLRRAGPAVAPIIPDVAEALALEDDPYRWGVLVDVLLNAPENAGSAVPILQKARHDDDFFTRFRADRALRAISKTKQVP